MPRPVWSGMITFGLVNIPVKLYNSVKKMTVRFHQLRKNDGCRITYKKVCTTDDKEVPNEQLVRGFEVSPDHFIVISAEELDSLSPKATRSIEIEDFVKLEQIDPVYYEQSFYLVPDKGADKSYTLLLKAMQSTGRVGIARLVLRNKEYLAALRPSGRALSLSTMLFHEEVAAPGSFENLSEGIEPDSKELAMANALIESLSMDFDLAQYHDNYHRQVMELIENKAEDDHFVTRPAVETKAKVIDIMAALEASLAAAKKKLPPKPGRKKALGR
jgi:DNA end-binding protein Ku